MSRRPSMGPRSSVTPSGWTTRDDAAAAIAALPPLALDPAHVATVGAWRAASNARQRHPLVVRALATFGPPSRTDPATGHVGGADRLGHQITRLAVRSMRAHLERHPDALVFVGDADVVAPLNRADRRKLGERKGAGIHLPTRDEVLDDVETGERPDEEPAPF
jgi:hypothetical protein